MGYSRFDPAMQARAAWNAGKTVGAKRPLTQKQIWAIRFHLDREGRLRDKALFDLAIDSKLRGCDLVKIKIAVVVAGADVNCSPPIRMASGFGVLHRQRGKCVAELARHGFRLRSLNRSPLLSRF